MANSVVDNAERTILIFCRLQFSWTRLMPPHQIEFIKLLTAVVGLVAALVVLAGAILTRLPLGG